MKNIGTFTVNNMIGNLIEKELTVHPEHPYGFIIYDQTIWGNGLHIHTHSKINKIKAWAEKLGAEVKVIKKDLAQVLIEITDPVALQLEMHLRSL